MTLRLRAFDDYFTDPQPCNALKEVQDWMLSEEGIAWKAQDDLRLLMMQNNLNEPVVIEEVDEMAA